LITANLGAKDAKSTFTLNGKVLGTSGEYKMKRIDSATGKEKPYGTSTGSVTTSVLGQWGIEGFKFSKN
jgi:hypothetical protein